MLEYGDRHCKKLVPATDYHDQLLDDFLTKFWDFQLLAYRLNPTTVERKRLNNAFNELFYTTTILVLAQSMEPRSGHPTSSPGTWRAVGLALIPTVV